MPAGRHSFYDPIIVAHRGLHFRCPENSLTAFRRARDEGVPWVECDVWPSSDGQPIVLHDETLDRTTAGAGFVGMQDFRSLQAVQLKGDDGQPPPDERIPHLRDVIDAMSGREAAPRPFRSTGPTGLLVEVKPSDQQAFVEDLVHLLSATSEVWMLQSFDEANLRHALAFNAETPVAMLVEDRAALERAIANGWKSIHLEHELLDATTARRLRRAGVSIGVWTVNLAHDLRRVVDLRADMIITDEPAKAMQMLRDVGNR